MLSQQHVQPAGGQLTEGRSPWRPQQSVASASALSEGQNSSPARDLVVVGAVGQPVPQNGMPLGEEVGLE